MGVASDNPITNAGQDVLGRADSARAFAAHVVSLGTAEGVVVGVLGPWGSGKTSFVNLAREDLAEAGTVLVDFNPWMFSGTEQLVDSFFIEISSQLKLKPGLVDVGRRFEDYGEAFAGLGWLPMVGPWIERGRGATKILGKLLQRRKEGTTSRRARVTEALRALERPIIVVLDDVDRLTTAEIRDVFKLVRLTASFPNIVYLVAFDRSRVETALGEQGISGRDYLEKILQIAVDLPAVPERVLVSQVLKALDEATAGLENPGPLDEAAWPDVFVEVIQPLVRNMRDVRRYAASVHGTLLALGGRIAMVDVLALEAIRVFIPDVFARMPAAIDALTTTSGLQYGGPRDAPELKASVDGLIAATEAYREVVRSLIMRVFPAAQRHIGGTHYGADFEKRWLRGRRVAHAEILRLYLERVAGEGLQAFTDAERAWGMLIDAPKLDAYLRSLDPDRLQDVIGALENYEQDFGPLHVVPGVVVLMNLLPDLPERPRGMFDLETSMVVGRVTSRLLRQAGDQDATAAAVRAILPQLRSLTARWQVLVDVGYEEGAGHKLISEPAAQQLEREWREELRAAAPDELAHEQELLRMFWFARRDTGQDEARAEVPADPAVTLAMLRSAKTETRSQTLDSRNVRRSPRLAWDTLVSVYGSDDVLADRLDATVAVDAGGHKDLLELAQTYRDGWRPPEFGHDPSSS